MKNRHHRNWLHSVYFKYIVLFVGIVWFSSAVAFTLIAPRTLRQILDLYQARVVVLAGQVQAFCEDNPVAPDEVAGLLDNEDYEITVFRSWPEFQADGRYGGLLTEAQYGRVMAGEILSGELRSELRLPFAGVRAGEDLMVIRPRLRSNMIPYFRSILARVLLIGAGLGSFLITVFTMLILRPVRKLTDATKEIARGNFDIHVPVKSNDEIGQLADSFNTMATELQNMEVLRKDFISNVSHEFKTPITSIQGYTRLIREPGLSQAQFDEYTGIILSESGRLANLSTSLLRLSKLDNQAIPEPETRYALDEQIRRVIVLLEDLWGKKRIEFDLDLENAPYQGHEELLQQVWINLISNAVKFSHEGGVIRIGLHRIPGHLVFTIADHGVGIPDEAKPRIFERFFKADASRSAEGNGLGLAIVKKIVEMHDGRVAFESEPGRGTTFTVVLKDSPAP